VVKTNEKRDGVSQKAIFSVSALALKSISPVKGDGAALRQGKMKCEKKR